MTKVTVFSPVIDDLFDEFFPSFRPDADPKMRTRIEFVRADLWQHLDREGWRVLTECQQTIVNAEKQLDPEGAFARTMHADDLFYCLDHYLDPAHATIGIEQRRVQVDVAKALAARIKSMSRVMARVSECCAIEIDIAVQRAERALKGAISFEKELAAGRIVI